MFYSASEFNVSQVQTKFFQSSLYLIKYQADLVCSIHFMPTFFQ